MHVAVPRVLPFFGKRPLPDALVKLIAYFLADGGLTQGVPAFTNARPRVLRDFTAVVDHFPGMRCRVQANGTRARTLRVVRSFEAIRRARQKFSEGLRDFLGGHD